MAKLFPFFELPPYRFPSCRSCAISGKKRETLSHAFTVITLVSVLVCSDV